MRLSEKEINAIKVQKQSFFSQNAKVYLFGSRLDDAKKGGDIDLFIECDKSYNTFKNAIRFKTQLKRDIGDQKIDLVVKSFNEVDDRAIITEARKAGVML